MKKKEIAILELIAWIINSIYIICNKVVDNTFSLNEGVSIFEACAIYKGYINSMISLDDLEKRFIIESLGFENIEQTFCLSMCYNTEFLPKDYNPKTIKFIFRRCKKLEEDNSRLIHLLKSDIKGCADKCFKRDTNKYEKFLNELTK